MSHRKTTRQPRVERELFLRAWKVWVWYWSQTRTGDIQSSRFSLGDPNHALCHQSILGKPLRTTLGTTREVPPFSCLGYFTIWRFSVKPHLRVFDTQCRTGYNNVVWENCNLNWEVTIIFAIGVTANRKFSLNPQTTLVSCFRSYSAKQRFHFLTREGKHLTLFDTRCLTFLKRLLKKYSLAAK